ncbi:phage portal protein [Shewanella frigidimarina]|uniref:phage portal protein n=1 Tax=Shewanella frigidimarina TaxID=56812 RepID=UPI003D7B7A61
MILDINGRHLQQEPDTKSFQNFSYMSSFSFGGLSVAGVNVNAKSAMKHSVVAACLRALTSQIAQLPVRLYELKDGKRTKVQKHKMLTVLTKRPNDYMTWQDLLEMIILHMHTDGNFYAYVNRNRLGTIAEIIPIPNPSAVSVDMQRGVKTFKISKDTIIGLPKDLFTTKEMIHIKSMSTDGLKGMSPIIQGAKAIGISMAAEEYAERFFLNDAKPGGVLTMPAGLSDEAFDRVKNSWNQNHQGTKKSNNVSVLEDGMTYAPIAVSNKDAQFLETRAYQKLEVCGIFGVPPQAVSADSKVTFNNQEQAYLSFHRDTLVPLIKKIQDAFDAFLPDELDLELDAAHLLRGDSKAQIESEKALHQMGALTINELRAAHSYDDFEGGDVSVVATNNITLGLLSELKEIQAQQAQLQKPTPQAAPDEPSPEPSAD